MPTRRRGRRHRRCKDTSGPRATHGPALVQLRISPGSLERAGAPPARAESEIVGDHRSGATPVPIPNTAVKPGPPMILPCGKVGHRRRLGPAGSNPRGPLHFWSALSLRGLSPSVARREGPASANPNNKVRRHIRRWSVCFRSACSMSAYFQSRPLIGKRSCIHSRLFPVALRPRWSGVGRLMRRDRRATARCAHTDGN